MKVAALGIAPLFLAACEEFFPVPPVDQPDPTPETPVAFPEPSAQSKALRTYYQGVQTDLISQGLLRTDNGSGSAPFGPRELTENFVRIALYDEYTIESGRLIPSPQPSRLRKWDRPITISVEFGETVPIAQRRNDLRNISAYAARLSRNSGLPISVGNGSANFHVLILNEDERLAYGPRLRELVPGISPAAIRTMVDMPKSTLCLVNAFAGSSNASAFSAAVAVIRAEHPDRLRLSCIHEEIAQGLGLANDSPNARPSIFNDDEEFALLTLHDELLLQILYSPRLRIGMTEAEATPIVRSIANDILGGS